MAGRQRRELIHTLFEEATGTEQDRTNALFPKICKGRFEIAVGSGIHNNELEAQRASGRLQVCNDGLGIRTGRVRENAKPGSIGYQPAE